MDNDAADPHADEALGAIIGMIENYGVKADDGQTVFTAYVSTSLSEGQFLVSVSEWRLYGTLPGDVAVIRHAGWKRMPQGDPVFQRDASKRLYPTRVAALRHVAEVLAERMEVIKAQYDRLRDEIAEIEEVVS